MRKEKHGLCRHPLYSVWEGIKARCYNKNSKRFTNYGGRGIVCCEQWKNNPENFIKWGLENGWQKGLQIDRINNDGNYSPENCKFSTNRENNSNKQIHKNRSLPIGVRQDDSGYSAVIKKNNIRIYLGRFKTPEDAHSAYLQKLLTINEGL